MSLHKEKPARRNNILASLPPPALEALEPYLTSVSFEPDQIVLEIGQVVDYGYFPTSGFCSLQITMKDGRTIDTAFAGRESVLEPLAALTGQSSATRCIARTRFDAQTISTNELRGAAARQPAIFKACINYGETLLSQTRINAARCAVSLVDARLAACLLEVSDLLEAEILPLPQEVLASLLSVRRTSVTEAAGKLRNAGLIDYSRGIVTILDRVGLVALAA